MRRLSMEKIREIIRLKEAGLSDRMIHRALFVSRPVVKEYVEKIRSAGLDYTAIRDMADESLTEVIEGRKSASERYPDPKQSVRACQQRAHAAWCDPTALVAGVPL